MKKRLTRRHLWGLLLTLPIFLLFGGCAYAHTNHAARQVSNRLSQKLAVPVQFESLSTGLLSTEVRELKLFEPDADAPWFEAKRVKLGLSLFGAVFGFMPNSVEVEEVTASLRFDKEGDLLTVLPQTETSANASSSLNLPTLAIQNASVTIQQTGHPTTSFSNLQLALQKGETSKQMVLSGEMNDPVFGEWRVEGNCNTQTGQAHAKVATKYAKPINMETLRKVPFVNPNAWKEIHLTGQTTAELFVDVDVNAQDGTYRLVLQPTQVNGFVPVAGLTLEQASGTVVARGQTLELIDVKAKTAEGEVLVHSFMDFSYKDKDIFYFETEFEGVEVSRLPDKLMLPKKLEGKATGQANFGFTVLVGGGVNTYGLGHARIENPTLGELIEVKISDDGVEVDDPRGKVPPPKKTPNPNPFAPIDDALKNAAQWFENFRKQVGPIPVKVNLRNVDVAEILKALEIDSPMKIEGKADAKLEITIPSQNTDKIQGYKISGTLSSAQLKIDNVPLDQIEAKFLLAEGKLNIKEIKAKLPAVAGKNSGNLQASGYIGTEEPYPFHLSLQVEEFNLQALTEAKGFLELPLALEGITTVEGMVTGQIGGKTSSLSFDPNPKKNYLNIKGNKLLIGSLPIDSFEAQIGIQERAKPENGTWGQTLSLNVLTGNLLGGQLSLDKPMAIPLQGSDSAQGKVLLKGLDLGQIAKAFPAANAVISGVIQEGEIALSTPAVTDKNPRTVTANVKLSTEKLRIRGFPVSKVQGKMVFRDGIIKYLFQGNALGGEIDVEGQYPDTAPPPKKTALEPKVILDSPHKSFYGRSNERTYGVAFLPPLPPTLVPAQFPFGNTLTLTYRDQRLSKLLADIGPGLQRKDLIESLMGLEGRVSGTIPLRLLPGGKIEVVGRAQIQLADVTFDNRLIFRRGNFSMKSIGDLIQIDESAFEIGNGRLSVVARFDLFNPERAEIRMDLDRVDPKAIPFLENSIGKSLDLPLSGRLVTSAGRNRDWRGNGTLTCAKGTIQGVAMTDIRLPMTWNLIPSLKRIEVGINEFSANSNGGRITGSLKINRTQSRRNGIEGVIDFSRVDVGPALAPRGGENSSLRISGKVILGGEIDESQKGLTAKIDARLTESNPFRLPVFANVGGALGVPIDNLSVIKEGEMQAELRDSVVRLKRMTVSGTNIEAFSEGTFTLDGKIDIHVVATTKGLAGGGAGRQLAQLAQQNAAGILTADGFTQAAGLLSNLTIYLDVTGLASNPDVRVRSAPTLGRAAITFFLTRAIPPLGLNGPFPKLP